MTNLGRYDAEMAQRVIKDRDVACNVAASRQVVMNTLKRYFRHGLLLVLTRCITPTMMSTRLLAQTCAALHLADIDHKESSPDAPMGCWADAKLVDLLDLQSLASVHAESGKTYPIQGSDIDHRGLRLQAHEAPPSHPGYQYPPETTPNRFLAAVRCPSASSRSNQTHMHTRETECSENVLYENAAVIYQMEPRVPYCTWL